MASAFDFPCAVDYRKLFFARFGAFGINHSKITLRDGFVRSFHKTPEVSNHARIPE